MPGYACACVCVCSVHVRGVRVNLPRVDASADPFSFNFLSITSAMASMSLEERPLPGGGWVPNSHRRDGNSWLARTGTASARGFHKWLDFPSRGCRVSNISVQLCVETIDTDTLGCKDSSVSELC